MTKTKALAINAVFNLFVWINLIVWFIAWVCGVNHLIVSLGFSVGAVVGFSNMVFWHWILKHYKAESKHVQAEDSNAG